MDENRRSIEEAVGSALSHGGLTYRGETACNLDKVMALGLVGIDERLADAVFRLKYSNDAGSYLDALDGVRQLLRSVGGRQNWRLRGARADGMAKAVLDYWISDTCVSCTGLMFVKALGAPNLTATHCPACDPLRPGKRPYPWVLRRPRIKDRGRRRNDPTIRRRRAAFERFMEQHKALLCELEEVEQNIGGKLIAKLAQRVRER